MSESHIRETYQLPAAGAEAIPTGQDEALVHSCRDAARWSEGKEVKM